LGTTIRKYVVAGQSHWANSNDPSIPAALSPVVAGVFTLHNFYKKPESHPVQGEFTAKAVRQSHPEFTSSTGAHALAPADYYTIYSFNPLGGREARTSQSLGDLISIHKTHSISITGCTTRRRVGTYL
jgi:hypothetical protein